MHECKKTFKVREIDDCSVKAFNRCYGDEKLILELYFQDQDGTECYFDNWIKEEVNFCPYCGYQPERLSPEGVKICKPLPDCLNWCDPTTYASDSPNCGNT